MKSLSDLSSAVDGSCGVDEKQCRKCGGCFPATPEYFSRDKKGQMGLHYWCKVCTRANGKRYKKQNPNWVKAYNQRWYEENRRHVSEYKWQYREAHKEYIAEWKRQYREDNWEAIAVDKRRYAMENPEKGKVRGHRRRARLNGAGGKFTKDDLNTLYNLQRGRCCWCSRPVVDALAYPKSPRDKKYTINHIRPIARYGTNWPWNLVLACQYCNGSHGPRMVFTEWQPPQMLDWMRDYLIDAMMLDVIWQVWLWRLKTKIGF